MEVERSESLEARRERLDAQLNARRKVEPDANANREASKGYALAVKLSSEFIAGVVVGVLLGYLFDRFLGTSPWGLIVFLLLGFCAGVLNVLRSTGAVAQPGSGRAGRSGTRDEDDGK
ncbi:AtpZ/AtpI family protein [Hoeflea sp. YIM 152468]|uniref:AtpZ/AtpI family protein n=1 Tax=Hoeflea sp. YIM 152468 TaxID=3031759 RepID=UPI0023D9D595|nr:AtpZ/AtpI family protein [Hoeflea sp. YIM 152468]MDF1606632.1 AtpZ/AtpI family protein [Hoeflea sp. YIM 152468]